jgi:hypothetical protein
MTSERVVSVALVRAVLAAAAAVACLGGGCADFSRGAAAAGAGDAAATDAGGGSDAALSFAVDVHAILTTTCQPCHAQGKKAGDTTFLLTGDVQGDYAVVLPFVDTSAASASRLLAKMSGNGHGGGTLYAAGTPEYQTVLRWIQEGAPP